MSVHSQSPCWFGFDPGGKKAFGIAVINDHGVVATRTTSSVLEAISVAKSYLLGEQPKGAGIDAPLWWSAREGGGRLVDEKLRRRYSISSGTIQSPNSLRGAVLTQGLLLVQKLREEFPDILISEAHPKALLRGPCRDGVDCLAGVQLGSYDASDDDHERDAVLAALAVREGGNGNWNVDISEKRFPEEQDPKKYWASPVHYFWPETISP
ncbi:DUF429 domain-containing protein [Roseovarius tolerans]|uniref:DUF429 domain-containing protein n=1 Tax=Roseovarius tolerans TaxID=74031 RepID=UPI0013649D4B|nr:DUF429 domain-containing protein [Roseovarius tolerans]